MLLVLSKNRIKTKNHGSMIGTYVTFNLKQEHEFLPDPSYTLFYILFSAPKMKVQITNYKKKL